MKKENIIKLGIEVTKVRNDSIGVEKRLLDVITIILAHIARPDISEYREMVESMGAVKKKVKSLV